jgi:hypothetical protein
MTPTICSCGHDGIAHPGDGPCMEMTCDCTHLAHISPYDAQGSVWYGPDLWNSLRDHQAKMRQHADWQATWTTTESMERAELIRAKTRTVDLAWWLLATCVPLLTIAICWAAIAR